MISLCHFRRSILLLRSDYVLSFIVVFKLINTTIELFQTLLTDPCVVVTMFVFEANWGTMTHLSVDK